MDIDKHHKFLLETYHFAKKSYIKSNLLFRQFLFEGSYKIYSFLPKTREKQILLTVLFLNTPFVIIKTHIKEVLDVIVCTLNEKNFDINPTIELLSQIIDTNINNLMDLQGESLINNLLNRLNDERMETLKKIINCIGKCSNIIAGTFKLHVIDGLRPLLNHKKRIIRQEAAMALNIWYSS